MYLFVFCASCIVIEELDSHAALESVFEERLHLQPLQTDAILLNADSVNVLLSCHKLVKLTSW